MTTTVVNLMADEPYDVYIGRPADSNPMHFGNPFAFAADTKAAVVVPTREACIKAFDDWLQGKAYQDIEPERRRWIWDNMEQLRDKRLGCFCKQPNKYVACHGDVYVQILDKPRIYVTRHVAIIGSRDFPRLDWVDGLVRMLPLEWVVVSGGAIGVDGRAEKEARRLRMADPLIFLPDYKQYGKKAPLIRNCLIVDHADYIVAFWNGVSRGTLHSITYARSIGKEPLIFLAEREPYPRKHRAKAYLGL